MSKRVVAVFLSVLLAWSSVAEAGGLCRGKFYNPITDVNWLAYMFPIFIGGVNINLGGGYNPPMMQEPAICVCPSHVPPHPPVPGIGMTYWEPLYLVESTRKAGCLHTLGGVDLGVASKTKIGIGATNSGVTGQKANTLYIHWMTYPLWAILRMFSDGVCMNGSGVFDLAYVSEVDPTWNNDEWSVALSPEASLFSSQIAQMACPVDGIAASVSTPIEGIFWCVGSWGPLYPFSGNTNTSPSYQTNDAIAVIKHIQRWARVGNMRTTIGPAAICHSTFSPLTPKGQWRLDPVWPVPYMGASPVYPGKPDAGWGYLPPTQRPTQEDGAYQIFVGTQCCLRP